MPFYMTLPNPSETQPLLCPHGPDLAPPLVLDPCHTSGAVPSLQWGPRHLVYLKIQSEVRTLSLGSFNTRSALGKHIQPWESR